VGCPRIENEVRKRTEGLDDSCGCAGDRDGPDSEAQGRDFTGSTNFAVPATASLSGTPTSRATPTPTPTPTPLVASGHHVPIVLGGASSSFTAANGRAGEVTRERALDYLALVDGVLYAIHREEQERSVG
jgi:hypothetical protein